MKKTLLLLALAAISATGFTAYADEPTVVERSENAIEKAFDATKKEVKKDAKAIKKGTVKAYDKTAKATKKAYKKAEKGTVKAY
ncbi:MAG: hypothetical protein K2L96_09105 [Muribaculaceae bacterium]|nr:hypothetical protein [Muribaculaceae bacterium]